MNKIVTAYASSGQPFRSPTDIDFWQNANKEAIANVVIGMIGDTYSPTTWYRLFGAELIPTAGDYYYNSAGAVFYAGEVYTVDAVSGGGGTNMPDGIKLEVYETTTGACTMRDGTTQDLNAIRKARYANDPTGADTTYRPTEAVIKFTNEGEQTGHAFTLSFEGDSFIHIISDTGTVTLTLDATRALPNATYTIYLSVFSGATTFAFAPVSGQFIFVSGELAITTDYATMVIKYIGNDGTNDLWVAYQTTQQ